MAGPQTPDTQAPLNDPALYAARVTLANCSFPEFVVDREKKEIVWQRYRELRADDCVAGLNKAASGGSLSELPKVILALRGRRPDTVRGDWSVGNLSATLSDELRKEGRNKGSLSICTTTANCVDDKPYTRAEVDLASAVIMTPLAPNPNRALVVAPAGAAMIGFVDGYMNPQRYLGDHPNLAAKVAADQAQERHSPANVTAAFRNCLRNNVGNVGATGDIASCATAGVRSGMYKRAETRQAGM